MLPQYIYLALLILGLGIALAKHGEPKPPLGQRYNFWVTLFDALIVIALLNWGGFFDGLK